MDYLVMFLCVVIIPLAIFIYFAFIKDRIQSEEEPVKGRILGALGMLYMGAYALFIHSTMYGAETGNIGEALGKAIAIKMLTPFFYCVIASAIMALISVVSKKKTFMLLALAATAFGFFVFPNSIKVIFIPAALFLASYIRMSN